MRLHRLTLVSLLLSVALTARGATPCGGTQEFPLRLPSTVPAEELAAYEKEVLTWLNARVYAVKLNWCGDKGIRDTGPWIDDTYYGTHKAAKIYYSPAVMAWLKGGRTGVIPDGAMIIKEQFEPPAARYEDQPDQKVTDWTVMVKDSKGSADGWWWGELYLKKDGSFMDFDNHDFAYPNAGFGIYCTRCHASAEKEQTFSALNNIEGFPGEPLTFRVDDSWRNGAPPPAEHTGAPTPPPPATAAAQPAALRERIVAPIPEFLQTFLFRDRVTERNVAKLPNEAWDHIPANGQMFLTSDQCESCHAAANGPFGPTMFLPKKDGSGGVNVSPYTEWRWSPMGLAGRDPIFFAQLDSELSYLDTVEDEATRANLKHTVINTCFRCHGVMGKRQHDIDHPGQNFDPDYVTRTGSQPGAKYGALARDGISCASCHKIRRDVMPPGSKQTPLEFFLSNTITGRFQTGDAGEIFGPFRNDEIVTLPMDNALKIKPVFNEYTKSSRMCGSCHTIDLPVVDNPPVRPVGPTTPHSIEQATYLEWLNSAYQNEFGKPGKDAQTCQDCHMPKQLVNEQLGVDVNPIRTRIAIVEDDTYPAAEHRAPAEQIRVRFREKDFARHELLGMNAFVLEMFNQFSDVLGVRKSDYMTGTSDNLQNTQSNLFEQARKRTARLETKMSIDQRTVDATVTVTNLTGHRFPSGVGFRRAFIELLVLENRDGAERVVWSSGRTNSVGVIVDGAGRPLRSEFFTDGEYQKHHEVITSDQQVQIYEELLQDANGKFTTSFIRRDHDIKDNRVLPLGWSPKGPDPSLNGRFLKATHPHGNAEHDPEYLNGKGQDTVRYRIALPPGVDPSKVSVRASLYYQSIPPYFLNERFTVGKGDATKRLYYIASNLNLNGTPMENWKILIARSPN
ncbi:MAG TPA: cytochrome P460 family protein [Thermoanaerobaculia bacterium]|nr:cytochrome P460 family protein [Thermoanaerobaculia bacterium]